MAQSESNKAKDVPKPKRTFTTEFFVGLFTILTLLCAAYLAVGLGGLNINASKYYTVHAEFDNISGLTSGASVEIAGVKVGDVTEIQLEKSEGDKPASYAIVSMKIKNEVKLLDDDIVSIRTKGIIGDKYVKLSRGSSDIIVGDGEYLSETESVIDIEDLIGKFVHNFGSEDEDE